MTTICAPTFETFAAEHAITASFTASQRPGKPSGSRTHQAAISRGARSPVIHFVIDSGPDAGEPTLTDALLAMRDAYLTIANLRAEGHRITDALTPQRSRTSRPEPVSRINERALWAYMAEFGWNAKDAGARAAAARSLRQQCLLADMTEIFFGHRSPLLTQLAECEEA